MARLKMSSRGLVVADLLPIAMTFVLLGMFLSLGVWINKDLGETTFATELVNNETLTFTNLTYTSTGYRISSIVLLSNGTYTVGSGNYSFENTGTVSRINTTLLCKGACINAGSFNVSYQAYKSAGYLVVGNSTAGLTTLSSWMVILAVVIAAGMVIGVLLRGFGGGGI